MDSQGRLFLRWNGFVSNAIAELKGSQNESEFFDVTVVAGDGGKVQANKLVLAGASSFFFKILKENPDPDPLIYLTGVSSEILQYLLNFIYTGEVRVHQDDFNDFLDIGDDLGVKGLISNPASEKTGSDKTKSTTPDPHRKHMTFEKSSPSPKLSHPPGVSSRNPTTHQNHVSGGGHSPSLIQSTASLSNTFGLSSKYSHPRVLSSITPDLSAEQSPSQSVTFSTPDLSSPQSATSSTPVLHYGRDTVDSPGPSARPYNAHKVTSSAPKLTTDEGAPVIKLETPSHYHSNFPEATTEENQGGTMFKVEVGDANNFNVHYDKNEHGELFVSRFSLRGLDKDGGNSDITRVEEVVAMSANSSEELEDIMEIDEQYDRINMESKHSVKKCTVKLVKMNKEQYEEAFGKINSAAKLKTMNISYSCQECTYKNKFKSNLTRHMQWKHQGVTYDCQECDYQTKYKGNLVQHMQKHQDVKYSCTKCSYEANYKETLKVHIQAKHGARSYFCQTCDYQSKYKSDLKIHIQGQHEGVRYACQKCSYKAKFKPNLSKHMVTKHT